MARSLFLELSIISLHKESKAVDTVKKTDKCTIEFSFVNWHEEFKRFFRLRFKEYFGLGSS